MHPLTLSFGGKLEEEYVRRHLTTHRKTTVALCAASSALSVIGFGIVWITNPALSNFARSMHVLFAAVMALAAVFNQKSQSPRLIIPASVAMTSIIIAIVVALHWDTKNPVMYALITLIAIVIASFPTTFKVKSILVFLLAAGVFAIALGLFLTVMTLALLNTPARGMTIHVLRLAVIGLLDRKSTRLNSSHTDISRMPSSA